ncbi:MAG: DUF554 domain-containing protein [Clostridia bacterium]|nr:DUF554 domain-containing protein [Clostridia bacterium]
MWGTVVNAAVVFLGAALGLLVHFLAGRSKTPKEGKRNLGKELSSAIMTGLAFCAFLIGVQGALKTQNILVVIISMAVGSAIGTLLDLDGKIVRLGDWVGKRVGTRSGDVSEGFVGASLLFCVGAMAVTGSLESGLAHNHATLYAKSLIDCVAAVVMASSLGFGVMLSSVAILIYQGSITLLAGWMQPLLTDVVINEMSAVGSLLIVGIGLNMLGVTRIKLMNYVIAIFLPILLCMFM